MKILYAVQGTGNGHVSRAREIIPYLDTYGDLDILLSGSEAEVQLPAKPKFYVKGLGYVFGKKGNIDYWKSFKKLSMLSLLNDVKNFPLDQYDLIINDFEPVTAWAAKLKKKKIISLGHQSAFLSDKTPRPEKINQIAEKILFYYAPSQNPIGFHFEPYDHFIHTPIIRREIRNLTPSNKEHITVYLPAIDDLFLVKILGRLKSHSWEVFSKHQKINYEIGNVKVSPIDSNKFTVSLASSNGLITSAGFETPAEALFLGKKMLIIPMIGQYEQSCNAEALRRMGVRVRKKNNYTLEAEIADWLIHGEAIKKEYKDETDDILKKIIQENQ
jgi:uncharacterized protein (TIGR00661 family)